MSETLATGGSTTNDAAFQPAAAAAAATQQPNATTQGAAATDTTTAAPADASKAGDQGAKPTEKVIPEKYEFKAPEGTKLDEELTGQLSGLAKELKLSQDEAQKVFDLGPKLVAKLQAEQSTQIQALHTQWANDTKADKEIGGDKLAENLSVAKKALEAFGSPALTKLLNETGLGNHPEMIRAFVKAGQAISQDNRHVAAGDSVAAPGRQAGLLSYPNHPAKL